MLIYDNFELPTPKKLSEYPIYTVFYGLVIWAVVILWTVFTSLPSITDSGKYIERRSCIEEVSSGRFEESTKCVEYSEPHYIPYGKYLKDQMLYSGIKIGFASLFVRGILYLVRRNQK